MDNPSIKRVTIEGLHDQFDVDLSLRPGLNILYGKNARGKTTLLHVIANILELDFARFNHLSFRSIRLETHAQAIFELKKTSKIGPLQVILNGHDTEYGGRSPELSDIEQETLRSALGARPVYLPAFRSILERVRSEATYRYDSNQADAFARIKEQEQKALLEQADDTDALRRYARYLRDDTAELNARKTIQCREWFGAFVPIVRYPSIREVTERLAAEYREAQLETGAHDRRMLSEMFVKVFYALLSADQTPNDWEVDSLMDRVRSALSLENYGDSEPYTDDIGEQLLDIVNKVKTRTSWTNDTAEWRVLKLYAQMLEQRNLARKSAFDKLRTFQESVNKFLDNKELRIRLVEGPRPPGTSPRIVYVETPGRRLYPLRTLSSGERQVLTMLFSASRSSIRTGVFLVDEPELSLHVDWQRTILEELMAQAGQRQIIACTHAPEVGADHPDAIQVFEPTICLSQEQDDDGNDGDATTEIVR